MMSTLLLSQESQCGRKNSHEGCQAEGLGRRKWCRKQMCEKKQKHDYCQIKFCKKCKKICVDVESYYCASHLEKEKPLERIIQGGQISHPGGMLGWCPRGTIPGLCPPGLNYPGSICCRRQGRLRFTRPGGGGMCPPKYQSAKCLPGVPPGSICCWLPSRKFRTKIKF